MNFLAKSGKLSGMLARIIPVLGYDRGMVRLSYERLPQYDFALDGLKKVLSIMERTLQHFRATDDVVPITLQFSQSDLDQTFRQTNELLVAGHVRDDNVDYRSEDNDNMVMVIMTMMLICR